MQYDLNMGQGARLTMESMRRCFKDLLKQPYDIDPIPFIVSPRAYKKLKEDAMGIFGDGKPTEARFEVQKAKNGYVVRYNGDLYIARNRFAMLNLIRKLTAELE